jgi:peptidoglycan/xylan/chitin deacetylase (PgdA/CDA1 family)
MSVARKIYSRASRKALNLFGDLLHFAGADKSTYQYARGSRIIVYHGICLDNPTRFNTLFITQKRFEEHLKAYKKHFNVVSLADYYAGRFSTDRFNICLTFDDGFANNYHYALPLLAKYKIPATFFVTAIGATKYDILWNDLLSIAGRLGPVKFKFDNELYYKNRNNKYTGADGVSLNDKLRKTGFDKKARLINLLDPLTGFREETTIKDYWQQMTAEQIRELAASPYASVGSHGYYHNDLCNISAGEAAQELTQSKYYLEKITGTEVNSIAFPYGSYNEEVAALTKAAGYDQLLATEFNSPQHHADPALRERLTINPFISTANQMYANIRGKYY